MSAPADRNEIPDAEIVILVRSGNRDAFDAIAKRHLSEIFGFFLSRLGPDHFGQVEDLTADTMEAALKTLSSGRSALPEDLKSWLYGVAKNVLAHHFKEKYSRREVLVLEPGKYDIEATDALDDLRQVEYEQGLPRFLQLVEDAIESMRLMRNAV
jgi:DNA-directed RNA polymerase specialized sigma24 family protein